MIEDKHNQHEEYMTLTEVICSTILFVLMFATGWLFLLITY